MKQYSIILALAIIFFSCEDKLDPAEETFLEINTGIMWQSTDQYYQNTYLGFSNNKAEVLVYDINVDSDYGYCESYREGENILQSSECDGELGDSTVIYTIITNIENLLELDVSYYDKSCQNSFSYSYQKSYSVDGDFVYETIESEGSESVFNEYSKTTSIYNRLCK
jgi:hypothetical protein